MAITGQGMFSFGNETALGSSPIAYLLKQAQNRDTSAYIIPTTPEQDAAVAAALRKIDASHRKMGKVIDNCSGRSNEGLDAAGIPETLIPDFYPGSAGSRAAAGGGPEFFIPKGLTALPVAPYLQFEPR